MITSRMLLLVGALAATAAAQKVTYESDAPRAASTLFFFDGQEPQGIVSIQYGAPEWKDEYRQLVRSDRAGAFRFGKDGWASLDVGMPLTFGARTVALGQYYLGLSRNAEGRFALLLLDADAVRARRVLPTDPGAVAAEVVLPLEFTETDALRQSLTARLAPAADDPRRGTLSIHWGPYVLSAGWTAAADATVTRKAAFDAAIDEMLALLASGEHEKLIRIYADPEFLARHGERIGEIVEGFAGEKAEVLRNALQQVRTKDVAIAADAETVSVQVDATPARDVHFRFIDGRWRIQDK